MTLRRVKLQPSTVATVELGDPNGPIPVIEIDDSSGSVYISGQQQVGTPGGADTQVQFNDGGTIAGNSAFTFNKATSQTTFGGPVILATHTPSSASDTGVAGQLAWDANFIYVCVTTNTWKRVAISTW